MLKFPALVATIAFLMIFFMTGSGWMFVCALIMGLMAYGLPSDI